MIGKFKHSFAKKETVAEAIVKSSVLSFISKVLGYVKYLAIAVFIGFNSKTDDYFMAIGLLGLFTIFVDVFNSIGVPNLVQALHSSEKEFHDLSGILLTFTAVLAGGITLLAAGLAPYLPHIAIGFTKANQKIISRIFFLFIPFLFFSFFFHHFGAILRSQRKFTVYFTGQFVLSLMSSILVLSILPFIRKIWVLPVTLSFSQGAATLFLLFYCRPYLSFKWFWNETTKEMGGQFLYLTGTYAIGHVFMLIDNLFASLLPPKTLTALNYGFAVSGIPRSLFPFSTIAITPLSETNASFEKTNQYLGVILLYSIPFILLTWLFVSPALKILLGYGRFSHLDLSLTAQAAKYYMFSLPLFMCWPVLYRVFQIKGKLSRILLFGVIAGLFNILLKYIFIVHLHFALKGITGSTFVVNLFLCGMAYFYFSRKIAGQSPNCEQKS